MKATQIVAPGTIEIIDLEEPRLSSEGMIKVKVEWACICGSDVPFFVQDLNGLQNSTPQERSLQTHFLDYNRSEMYPLEPGFSLHECIGTVVESTGARFREGDFVIALPHFQTGYREFFCVGEECAVHLPREGVGKKEILMTQPLSTVLLACRKLGNILGQDAVVVGSGPMGLLITHTLSNLGARTVITLDKLDYRLQAAEKMKATHTLNVDQINPVEAIEAITDGRMADLVVEAVGHQPDTIRDCFSYVKRRGTIFAFGVPDTFSYDRFPVLDLFRLNLRVLSSVGPDILRDYTLARDLIVQRRVDVSPLLTHTFPFHEAQKAYETFSQRKDGVIKALIDFNA